MTPKTRQSRRRQENRGASREISSENEQSFVVIATKYDIIKYFEETKTNYGGKSMSLNELGEWAVNRFGGVLKKPTSKASLNHVLKTKADLYPPSTQRINIREGEATESAAEEHSNTTSILIFKL